MKNSRLNKELFDEFRKLRLPLGEYIIVSSGVLAIRGIRAANDIDVAVSKKLWKELLQTYKPTIEKNVEKIIPTDNIEIFWEGSFGKSNARQQIGPTIDEQLYNAETMDDLSFQNLQDCLFFKTQSVREKDKKDVELIYKYLGINP